MELEASDNGRVIKVGPDINSELIQEEWMTYRHLLHTQTRDMQERITEVLQSPVLSTASIKRSFSAMKTIKTRLRNRLTDTNLGNLMKIAIEGPSKLSDSDLDHIVDIIW